MSKKSLNPPAKKFFIMAKHLLNPSGLCQSQRHSKTRAVNEIISVEPSQPASQPTGQTHL